MWMMIEMAWNFHTNGVYTWDGIYDMNGKVAQVWANKINDTYK